MNGILVSPTRLFSGLLLAWLALAAHSDGSGLRAFRPVAAQFQQASLAHGNSSPVALAPSATDDTDESQRPRSNPPDPGLPLAARSFVSLSGMARSRVERARSFALVRHAPCAAPQTGPPDLHAA